MKEDILEKVSLIDMKYVEAAVYPERRKRTSFKYVITLAACICMCIGALVSVLAATNENVYEMLYRISPGIAQKLKPVNVSCMDKGIEMNVVAAEIKDEKADILVSIHDTTGKRIDETVDLFDSYSIHTPYDQMGSCSLAYYDEETKTATFLIQIEQMKHQLIPGDKITFSVGQMLTGKKHFTTQLSQINLCELPQITDYLENVSSRGGSGSSEELDNMKLLKPDEMNTEVIDSGVHITGYGLIDDELHIQIRYDDIHYTDNHGYPYLVDEQGNQIIEKANVSFWDEEYKNSFQEYIFALPDNGLEPYTVWGEFWTSNSDSLIEGEWQVTFPVEKEDISA